MILKSIKRCAGAATDTRAFGLVLKQLEHRVRHQRSLRVLAYHRVDHADAKPEYYPGLISASPSRFETQIRFIADHYYVASMDEVIAAIHGEQQLPANSVQLTFDDATEDFMLYAWPILRRLDLPATVFVATAFPDDHSRHFWWDRLYRAVVCSEDGTHIEWPDGSVTLTDMRQRRRTFRHLKEHLKSIPHAQFEKLLDSIVGASGVSDPIRNNVMGWKELQQLSSEGVTLAAHTHTHPMLNQLRAEDIRNELVQSRSVLSEKIEEPIPDALAYPAGGVSRDVITQMQQCGFDAGFTTVRGSNDSLTKPLELKRINIGQSTTLGLLRLQLANWGKFSGFSDCRGPSTPILNTV